MASIKDELRHLIERLTDEEAIKIMDFARQSPGPADSNSILELLAKNPAVRIPTLRDGGFKPFHPVSGTGVPASRRLIEDRR